MSTSTEGVIKFALDFTPAPPLPAEVLRELDAWRTLLVRLGVLGQDPARYDGFGFGNVSRRLPPYDAPPTHRPFVITASQTGHLPTLAPRHYTLVRRCLPAENRVEAEGPLAPSSECLTHGTLYDLDAALRFVMHGHAPTLWRQAAALGLPATHPGVPYGSPEMAAEVERLFRETDAPARRLFVMAGHEDGFVVFGQTAAEAGAALVTALAEALARTRFHGEATV